VINQTEIVASIRDTVESGRAIPHMLFVGQSGVGKTTVAKIISEKTGLDIHEFNASDDRTLTFVREEVKKLASFVGRRIILLDEADMLEWRAQPALRRIMERTEAIFILTANDEWRIIDAIKSRCAIYRFKPLKPEDIQKKIVEIVRKEGIAIGSQSQEERQAIQKGLKLLVQISEGDLRLALNYLETVVNSGNEITATSIATLSGAHSLFLVALTQALDGNFDGAQVSIEKAFAEGGFDPNLSFKMIYREIPKLDVEKELKIRLFSKLGEVEANSKRGSDPIIQLISFIAYVWLLPYLTKCPALESIE
jgi:replication factor C small subunit